MSLKMSPAESRHEDTQKRILKLLETSRIHVAYSSTETIFAKRRIEKRAKESETDQKQNESESAQRIGFSPKVQNQGLLNLASKKRITIIEIEIDRIPATAILILTEQATTTNDHTT